MSVQSPYTLSLKPKITNWIWSSAFACIILFFPTAIVGLIYAIKSRINLKKDNIKEAQKAARIARIWTLISYGIGLPILALEIIYLIKTGKQLDYFLIP